MKLLMIVAATLISSYSFADHHEAQFLGHEAIANLEECEGLNLTEEQKAELKEIAMKAKEHAKKLLEHGKKIHKAYAENVMSEEGTMEKAFEIGKHGVRLAARASALKLRVINAVLFEVMSSVEQRRIAAKCMHEKHKEPLQ